MSERAEGDALRFLTVAEASRWLQVKPDRIRAEIHEGRLRAARVGRLFRIRITDLEEWFENSLHKPAMQS